MKPDIKKKIDVIAQKLPPYLNIAWFAVALISLIAPLFSSDVAKITDYVFRSYTTLYFIFFLWFSQKKPKLIFRIVFSLLIPAVWVSCFFNTPKPIAIAETPLFFLIFLSAFACFIKSGLDLGLLF